MCIVVLYVTHRELSHSFALTLGSFMSFSSLLWFYGFKCMAAKHSLLGAGGGDCRLTRALAIVLFLRPVVITHPLSSATSSRQIGGGSSDLLFEVTTALDE